MIQANVNFIAGLWLCIAFFAAAIAIFIACVVGESRTRRRQIRRIEKNLRPSRLRRFLALWTSFGWGR